MQLLEAPLAIVDLETSGAHPAHDRVTEIAVIQVDAGEVSGEWSTLVNPETTIPPAIQALTGITNDMVAGAPTFGALAAELQERLEGRVLVALNARFDYGFLKNEFRRLGKTFTAPVLCTVKLSRKLFPQHPRHNLDTLMARHNIHCDARHRALGDARVLWQLAQQWRQDPREEAVLAATEKLLKTTTVPAGLADNASTTSRKAQAYICSYGDNDVPLYVGQKHQPAHAGNVALLDTVAMSVISSRSRIDIAGTPKCSCPMK